MNVFSNLTTPWWTPSQTEDLDKTVSIIFAAFLLFMLVFTLGIGGSVSEFIRSNVSIVFLLFLLAFSISQQDARPQVYGSYGKSDDAYKGAIIGVLVGSLSAIKSLSILVPFVVVTSSTVVLGAIFTALIVPFVEEKFFGGTLPFILGRGLKNPIFVVLLTSIIFGVFHLIAYKASIYLMISAMIFRAVVLVGNSVLKTQMFGISLHYANNIFAVLYCLKYPLALACGGPGMVGLDK